MLTKEKILETLKDCYDPEIPINIVDLGLVYDVHIENDTVHVKMTLTARGCPMADFLKEDVRRRLEELEGIKKANIEIVWDPPWTPERMNQEMRESV